MISIQHLTKRFGKISAVDDVSITIKPGQAVALWGANGAGKTTIIRCVTGLYRYKGTIHVNGIDATRHGKAARHAIGYVPQELGFNDDLRVGAAIRFFASLRGSKIDDLDRVLGRVNLLGQHAKRMRELSGGMKQRLALAIALIGDPPVLVLDEVTASLDAVGRGELVTLLSSIARDENRCVLFASHRVDEIEALANRVVMLERGKIVEDLTVRDFASKVADTSLLRLTIEARYRLDAIALLQKIGFTAHLNGRGILVPVAAGQRMRPIQCLAENSIAVHDFDLLSASDQGSHS